MILYLILRQTKIFCCAAALFTLSFAALEAADGPDPRELKWVSTGGPPGALSYEVVIHPDDSETIFMTDLWSGVNKSTNGGARWRPMNNGIITRCGPSEDAIPVFSFLIDPSSPNIMWAGTEGKRQVYKSTDAGETWRLKDKGIPDFKYDESVMCFAVDPTDSNTVYVGIDVRAEDKYGPSTGKLYKSSDGGEDWAEILDARALIRRIVIAPTNTKIIYAATGASFKASAEYEGVLKTTDGGKTWDPILEGLDNWTINELIIHPKKSRILYAATGGAALRGNDECGGVYKTTDGGENWQRSLGPERDDDSFIVTAFAMCESDPDILYAGLPNAVYRTDDAGKTWRRLNIETGGFSFGAPIRMAIDPTDPDVVYSNNQYGGIFKTSDGGKTWLPSNNGYTGAIIAEVAVSGDPSHTVYAAGASGLFKTTARGAIRESTQISANKISDNSQRFADENWEGLNTGLLEGKDFFASVIVNPKDPEQIFVGDMYSSTIFGSWDRGKTWEVAHYISKPLTSEQNEPDLETLADSEERIGVKTFSFAPSNPRIIFAATVNRECFEERPRYPIPDGAGIVRSIDGGESWSEVNDGLELTDLNVLDVAVHPKNPDIVYAGLMRSGIYKSVDCGATWKPIGEEVEDRDVRVIAIDPQNPNIMYVGAERAGVFKSEDEGTHWRAINRGMDAEASIRSLVVDPLDSNIIYAGDWRMGAYMSCDSGKSWARINHGLATRAILCLDVSPDGKYLYAATEGGGVFRTRLGGLGTRRFLDHEWHE